jgi:hypothetical protein
MDDPNVPVDVWIDDHNRVRRQRLALTMKPSAGTPAQKQTVPIGSSDFGADTSGIGAPDASDTYDATDQAAGALNGG